MGPFEFWSTCHTFLSFLPLDIKLMDGTSSSLRFCNVHPVFHLFSVTIHANHETGQFAYCKMMTNRSIWATNRLRLLWLRFIGKGGWGGDWHRKSGVQETFFFLCQGKMNCQPLMIDICIVIQIVSLALNIRYRSIYNEFR